MARIDSMLNTVIEPCATIPGRSDRAGFVVRDATTGAYLGHICRTADCTLWFAVDGASGVRPTNEDAIHALHCRRARLMEFGKGD